MPLRAPSGAGSPLGRTLEDIILRSVGAQHGVKLQRVAAPRLVARAVRLQRLPRALLQARRACARAPAHPQRYPLSARSPCLACTPAPVHVGSMPLQGYHCRSLDTRSVPACLCLFDRACHAVAVAGTRDCQARRRPVIETRRS
jgi:hypothetical protein